MRRQRRPFDRYETTDSELETSQRARYATQSLMEFDECKSTIPIDYRYRIGTVPGVIGDVLRRRWQPN